MDYEKKYKEALLKAKEYNFDGAKQVVKDFVTYIFPELKESEDERIKKNIIEHFKDEVKTLSNKGEEYEAEIEELSKYIAWLENQGESYTKRDIDDAYLEGVTSTKNEIEKQYEATYQIRKDIATFIFNYRGDIKDRAKWMNYLGIKVSIVEKQGEQKSIWHNEDEEPQKDSLILLIMQSGTPVVAKIIEPNHTFNHGERWAYINDLLEKQGEQKPTNKIEPKFHEGEWCIDNEDGVIFQIVKVLDNTYTYKTDKEYSCTHYSLENGAHLWSIKDAKRGDVLTLSYASKNYVLIYKGLNEKSFKTIMSVFCFYCVEEDTYYDETDSFHVMNHGEIITPATKEQRDLLFQKMKESGYNWDKRKLELKEIK